MLWQKMVGKMPPDFIDHQRNSCRLAFHIRPGTAQRYRIKAPEQKGNACHIDCSTLLSPIGVTQRQWVYFFPFGANCYGERH